MAEDYTFLRNDQLKIMEDTLKSNKAHIDFLQDTINTLDHKLAIYDKALEIACKDIAKSHPILSALGYDYYKDRYLKKARKENDRR